MWFVNGLKNFGENKIYNDRVGSRNYGILFLNSLEIFCCFY